MVLLSVGGNDIGFADVIKYYLAPARAFVKRLAEKLYPEVCPASNYRVDSAQNKYLAEHCDTLDRKLKYDAGKLIYGRDGKLGVARKLTLLFDILKKRLQVKPRQIVMAQYPDPLRTTSPSSPPCDRLSKEERIQVFGVPAGVFDPLSPWNGLKVAVPLQVNAPQRN